MSTKDLSPGNVVKQVYDPATESVQVNIVASTGAGGLATAAKQDVQTAILTDIENNTDGLETSITSIDNKTPALIGGKVPVDIGSNGLVTVSNSIELDGQVDAGNSSTTLLAGAGVFTGTAFDITNYACINVNVFSNVPSATNGVRVEFSTNGVNWDHSHSTTYTAVSGVGYIFNAEFRYARIVYINGASPQTAFRLQTIFKTTKVQGSLYTLSQTVNSNMFAELNRSIITGETTGGGGGYVNVKVNPSGALTVEADVTNAVLPPDAATESTLSNIDGKIISVDTDSVTVVSSTLPTGAATEAKQDTANTSLSSINTKLNPLQVLGSFVVDFSSIPNSVTAPYEITAGFGSAVKKIALYETTGETLQLRTGAASGSLLAYVGPGQDSPLEASINASTRITVRSNGSAPTAGSFIVTFLG
jgi:hypothetical protein